MALDYDFAKAKKFDIPERNVSIIVTDEGYYPKSLSVFKGEKVKFFVTSTSKNPSCLLLPEKKVFLSAQKGKLSEGAAVFAEKGVHKFYCPTGKIFGEIVVLERPSVVKKRRAARELASEKVKIWIPRDE